MAGSSRVRTLAWPGCIRVVAWAALRPECWGFHILLLVAEQTPGAFQPLAAVAEVGCFLDAIPAAEPPVHDIQMI